MNAGDGAVQLGLTEVPRDGTIVVPGPGNQINPNERPGDQVRGADSRVYFEIDGEPMRDAHGNIIFMEQGGDPATSTRYSEDTSGWRESAPADSTGSLTPNEQAYQDEVRAMEQAAEDAAKVANDARGEESWNQSGATDGDLAGIDFSR
jgi:hypothetical protein